MEPTQDVLDAIEHVAQDLGDEPICFKVTLRMMPLREISWYDDPIAWLELDRFELEGLPRQEVWDALAGFRGEAWADMAFRWIDSGRWPPVVVVAAKRVSAIGDGRGRFTAAWGLGMNELPVLLLEESKRGTLCVEVDGWDVKVYGDLGVVSC